MKSVRSVVLRIVLFVPMFAAAQQQPTHPAQSERKDQPTLAQQLDAARAEIKRFDEAFAAFQRAVKPLTMSGSPLKVRGGSIKAMFYNSSWTVAPNSSSTSITVPYSTTIFLDGVDPANPPPPPPPPPLVPVNQPQEYPYTVSSDWLITVTFRDGSKGEDASKKMYICTYVDPTSQKCAIDPPHSLQGPGKTIYFQTDSDMGVFNPLDQAVSDIPGMRFDLYCNGSHCTDEDPTNHIHSVEIKWRVSQSTVADYKHHCVDGMCVIAIGQ